MTTRDIDLRHHGDRDALPGVHLVPNPHASFPLVNTDVSKPWTALRARGFAVGRSDTFPGLGPHWIRVTVRDPATSAAFTAAFQEVIR